MEHLQKNMNNIRTCWKNSTIPNFLVKDSSGMRPQVVNLLFLFSRKLLMTWKAQRNSTISAGPEESNLGFLQATKSHIKTVFVQ